MSAPFPPPLHAVALHGAAYGRYAIKRLPFAGCWCSGSLDVPWPPDVPARLCRLRRLLCVAASNITATYAHWMLPHCPACARIRGRYVLRPSGKCRHTSQGQRPSLSVRGSKTGLVNHRPLAFCCLVVARSVSRPAIVFVLLFALLIKLHSLQLLQLRTGFHVWLIDHAVSTRLTYC